MAMVVFLVLFGFGGGSAAASCGSMSAGSVDVDEAGSHAPIDGYSGDQLKNAAYIMNAAEALGMTQQAQVIGVMTAMGESSSRQHRLRRQRREPGRVDRRLHRLFQQQSNWGSAADRMDPTKSATLFFKRACSSSTAGTPSSRRATRSTGSRSTKTRSTTASSSPRRRYRHAALRRLRRLPPPLPPRARPRHRPVRDPRRLRTDERVPAGGTVLPLTAPFDQTSGYGRASARPRVRLVVAPRANDYQTRVSGTAAGKSGYSCGSPVFASQAGTVTVAGGYTLSVKSAEGYTISYLHMYPSDMEVAVGDAVTPRPGLARSGPTDPPPAATSTSGSTPTDPPTTRSARSPSRRPRAALRATSTPRRSSTSSASLSAATTADGRTSDDRPDPPVPRRLRQRLPGRVRTHQLRRPRRRPAHPGEPRRRPSADHLVRRRGRPRRAPPSRAPDHRRPRRELDPRRAPRRAGHRPRAGDSARHGPGGDVRRPPHRRPGCPSVRCRPASGPHRAGAARSRGRTCVLGHRARHGPADPARARPRSPASRTLRRGRRWTSPRRPRSPCSSNAAGDTPPCRC